MKKILIQCCLLVSIQFLAVCGNTHAQCKPQQYLANKTYLLVGKGLNQEEGISSYKTRIGATYIFNRFKRNRVYLGLDVSYLDIIFATSSENLRAIIEDEAGDVTISAGLSVGPMITCRFFTGGIVYFGPWIRPNVGVNVQEFIENSTPIISSPDFGVSLASNLGPLMFRLDMYKHHQTSFLSPNLYLSVGLSF